MPINPLLNAILKRLWDIDERVIKGEQVSNDDREFYNSNASTIKEYYCQAASYWSSRPSLMEILTDDITN